MVPAHIRTGGGHEPNVRILGEHGDRHRSTAPGPDETEKAVTGQQSTPASACARGGYLMQTKNALDVYRVVHPMRVLGRFRRSACTYLYR